MFLFLNRFLFSSRLSKITGKAAEKKLPGCLLKPLIYIYSNIYGINLAEAVIPETGFTTFNHFFTRNLTLGARHIDKSPNIISSPADGKVVSLGKIMDNRLFQIKGMDYSIQELLGNEEETLYFKDGHFITIYLAPSDYHRLHCPLDGEIYKAKVIPGKLYPVNSYGINRIKSLFCKNERLITFINTTFTKIAYIKVGAFNVGSISVNYDKNLRTNTNKKIVKRKYHPPIHIKKGAPLGKFNLGSTVILIFQKDSIEFLVKLGAKVQVGEKIAKWTYL